MEAIHLRDFIPDVGWLYKFSAVFHELIGLIWSGGYMDSIYCKVFTGEISWKALL